MKNSILKYLIIIASVNYSIAQKTDFIVNSNDDTIYVDKINLKFDLIKIKNNGKSKKYDFAEIKSFYDSKKKLNYEKVSSPFDIHKQYTGGEFFIIRLTEGKVKLFEHQGTSYYDSEMSGAGVAMGKGISYYIAIYDAKPELIYNNYGLKLKKNVYELLKIYLSGNTEIEKRLDKLFLSKPITKEEQIVKLINDYNIWVKLNN